MRHRASNGNAEALNSKIRLLRIKAKGYRNRERFKLGVMFHYGKITPPRRRRGANKEYISQ